MLDTIDLELIVNWIVPRKENLDCLKIPSRNITVSLRSWSQLSDNERIPVLGVQWPTNEGHDNFAVFRFPEGDGGFLSDIGHGISRLATGNLTSVNDIGRVISRLSTGNLTFVNDIGRVLDEVVTHEDGQRSSTRDSPWRYVRTMHIKKEPPGYNNQLSGVEVSWAEESRCDLE